MKLEFVKYIRLMRPKEAQAARCAIEEEGYQWDTAWGRWLQPLVWLMSYLSFYTYSEGSFNFRRLPFSGQFCYWGQRLDRNRKTDPVRRRRLCRFACEVDFFYGENDRDVMLHIGIGLCELFFSVTDVLPRKWIPKDYEPERTFGGYWYDRSIVLKFWKWMRFIHMPWDFTHVRWSVLLKDGNYWHETDWARKIEKTLPQIKKHVFSVADEMRHQEKFDYTYTLNNGEVQKVTATVGLEEREWRWKIFKWFRVPGTYRISRSIKVEFSDEVGEQRGTWKGGTLGCGYNMQPGETIEQTLRRMESERRFER